MNEKRYIAMVGQKHVPSREGGIEIVVEELSKRLVEQGHRVTCYNRKIPHVCGKQYKLKKTGVYQGIQIKEVFAVNKKGLAALTSSFVGAFCIALGKYDVAHFHAEGPAAMCWIPKLFGKKVIVTIHGLDWKREKWGKFASKYIMFGEKCAVKFADEIIVLSRDMQQYFRQRYGRKTVYIPNAVNRPRIRPAEQIWKRFGLQKDEYILFLGRIVPEKGLRYLINAFKDVKTNKKLVIAGGTSDTDSFFTEMKNLAKEDSRILFTNFVQGEILDELYSNAYVFVQPSDIEGMSLSLLEAMSYGNCCLVSSIPECTEVVQDKAVVFPKRNVEELTKSLQMLCDREDVVEKYKKESADYICKKYNWNEVVEKTLNVYYS